MSPIILLAVLVFIGVIVLWLVAELKWSRRARITLGLVLMTFSLTLAIFIATAVTQLDTNSYYAASVRTLLDETIEALEAEEDGFSERLKVFRQTQKLTYESRSNLLEGARAFRQEGKRIRTEQVVAGQLPARSESE